MSISVNASGVQSAVSQVAMAKSTERTRREEATESGSERGRETQGDVGRVVNTEA